MEDANATSSIGTILSGKSPYILQEKNHLRGRTSWSMGFESSGRAACGALSVLKFELRERTP